MVPLLGRGARNWYIDLGMKPENLQFRPTSRRALALLDGHLRRRLPVPVGLRRARGHRQPHRLRPQGAHRRSGKDLTYFDQEANERFLPYVIEPAAGATRTTFAFLIDAYHEEEVRATPGSC